jgi:hypothetical protein
MQYGSRLKNGQIDDGHVVGTLRAGRPARVPVATIALSVWWQDVLDSHSDLPGVRDQVGEDDGTPG